MKKEITILILVFTLFSLNSFAQETVEKFISFKEKSISYTGRVGITDTCAEIYWSGTNMSINVKSAATVKALLADTRDDNYYYVIVDGDGSTATKIKIDKAKKIYTLASFHDRAKHHVELFKITNTDDHVTLFYGFEVDKDASVLKPAKKPKRKIEFFGNSITCGHGVEVPADSADSGLPQYFNNYKAYGAITARHFNAQYHCSSKSGIGVMISWFPQIMPEIYDRLNPSDPNSKWEFSSYTPNIVVVNLFQNDSWLVNQTDHEQFKAKFGNTRPTEEDIIKAYASFIHSLRYNYPKATIICCLGNMDATKEGSRWPGYIESAVASMNDKKIITHFFPYKNTPGHPKVNEQEAMADGLIKFIEAGKYWK